MTGHPGRAPGTRDDQHRAPPDGSGSGASGQSSHQAGQPAAPAEPPPELELQDVTATIADLRAEVEACRGEWKRALADADNLRKRFAREAEGIRAQERAAVVRQWLPVLDNLDRALEYIGPDPQAIIEGVRVVRDQALQVLAELGFGRRDDTGEQFDPARHDAVGSRPGSGAPPGTVVQVVRPAYGAGERQLRPASVVVAAD